MATTTDPPNPLYFGYYPGDPIKPKRYYVPYKRPGEPIDWTGFDEYLDLIEEDFTGVPRGVWNQIWRDFNATLKAQVRQKESVSVEQLEAFGEEVVEDMPGAFGISVSLDPRDWAKDPVGEAKSTLSSWGSAALNWNDFENQHRKILWSRILSDPDSLPPGRGAAFFEGEAMAALSARTEESQPLLAAYGNPLNLDVLGYIKSREAQDEIYDVAMGGKTGEYVEKSVYSDLKGAISTFQLNVKNAPARESKYDNVLYGSALALKWDLATRAAGPLTTEHTKIANKFIKKVDLATSIDKFRNEVTGGAGVSNMLNAFILTREKDPYRAASPDGANGKLIKAINNARTELAGLGLSPKEMKELKGVLGPYNKMLDDLESLTKSGSRLEKFSSTLLKE